MNENRMSIRECMAFIKDVRQSGVVDTEHRRKLAEVHEALASAHALHTFAAGQELLLICINRKERPGATWVRIQPLEKGGFAVDGSDLQLANAMHDLLEPELSEPQSRPVVPDGRGEFWDREIQPTPPPARETTPGAESSPLDGPTGAGASPGGGTTIRTGRCNAHGHWVSGCPECVAAVEPTAVERLLGEVTIRVAESAEALEFLAEQLREHGSVRLEHDGTAAWVYTGVQYGRGESLLKAAQQLMRETGEL